MGHWGPNTYPRHDASWAFGGNTMDADLVLAGTQKASALGDRQWDRPRFSTQWNVEAQCIVGCRGPLEAR